MIQQGTHLILRRSELLSVGEIVNGDGEEDVEESVVAEEGEDNEVERVDHAVADPPLGHDPVVHHLVPVLTSQDLENGEEGDDEGVEVGVWSPIREVEGSSKELHSQEGEDEDEEKEKEEKGEDGAHGVEKGDDEVPQRGPVLGHLEDPQQSQCSQHGQSSVRIRSED